jgi:preprotein translocase subunit SecD
MVVGLFDSLVEVQRTVADLIDAGYARNTISIVVRDAHLDAPAVRRDFGQDFELSTSEEDRSRGASTSVDVIKTAKVLAGGPLATVLRQSSLEHPEEPVVRALISAGLGLTSARYFADAICHGAVMIAVHCEDRYVRDTRDLLDAHATHAQHHHYRPAREESRSLARAS